MNKQAIKEILEMFEATNITKMELETDEFKIKLERYPTKPDLYTQEINYRSNATQEYQEVYSAPIAESKKNQSVMIYAPLVGTFYSSREQGGTPFVSVGDHVKKGDMLCIIEAMKVMNEIRSDCDGVIRSIKVQNEDMVQFKQELIEIG